jgi:hypothetical protein
MTVIFADKIDLPDTDAALREAWPNLSPQQRTEAMALVTRRHKMPFDDVVAERHAKVAEIIARHLAAIKAEILALDPETMNIDDAGDKAEIVLQVAQELVDQLRGFSSGSRMKRAEEEREEKELFGEDEAA